MNNARPKNLFKYVLSALIAALVISVLFVLPAEYGIDFTGLGKILGLTQLTNKSENSVALAKPADMHVYVDENDSTVTVVNSLDDVDVSQRDFTDPFQILKMGDKVVRTYPHDFLNTRKDFTLAAGERIEVKTVLNKDEMMVYSWMASEDIYVDFHGHPPDGSPDADKYPENFFVRYNEGVMTRGAGSLIAPFSGEHGWFWQNLSSEPVDINLDVSGFYSELVTYGEE